LHGHDVVRDLEAIVDMQSPYDRRHQMTYLAALGWHGAHREASRDAAAASDVPRISCASRARLPGPANRRRTTFSQVGKRRGPARIPHPETMAYPERRATSAREEQR